MVLLALIVITIYGVQNVFAKSPPAPTIRIRLELINNIRDLALFNLAIDSKLRGCDLVSLKIRDIAHGKIIQSRTTIVQKKTGLPVQFEITENTRKSIHTLLKNFQLSQNDYLFKSRIHASEHLSTRQYGRIVDGWVSMIGLDQTQYGTHTMRRTKPALIYKKTKNLLSGQMDGTLKTRNLLKKHQQN